MLDTANPETLRQVGRSPTRSDAPDKLTGSAIYVSDMSLPGMLYAQVKKSPHARAKIKRIDVSRAERLTGVRAVLTGHDLDYKMGLYVVDKDILAKNEVRHFGEAVAAVAADTLAIAHAAVELIEVEYEVLPPVLNHMDALAPDAPLVHPDLGSYDYVKAVFSPHPGTNIANLTVTRKATSKRASPKPSGSSSASTPTRRCSTCRWRPTSPSPNGRSATASTSGPARNRRSPCVACSVMRSGCRSTTCA